MRTDKFRNSGFHPDELTVALNKLGYFVQTIHAISYTQGPDNEVFVAADNRLHIDGLIRKSSGVIYWLPSHATPNFVGEHRKGGEEIYAYSIIMKF